MNQRTYLTEEILAEAELADWPAGDLILEYTGTPLGVYYLLEGYVKLVRLSPKGERRILHNVPAGHFIMEALYFLPMPRVVMLYAARQSRTAYFSRELTEKLIRTNPVFTTTLFESMAAKALSAGLEVVDLCYGDPDMRMLRVLKEAFRNQGGPNTREVSAARVRMTQAQLAERMGLHLVTVNRTLKKLEKQGYILPRRGEITLYLHRFPRTLQ